MPKAKKTAQGKTMPKMELRLKDGSLVTDKMPTHHFPVPGMIVDFHRSYLVLNEPMRWRIGGTEDDGSSEWIITVYVAETTRPNYLPKAPRSPNTPKIHLPDEVKK